MLPALLARVGLPLLVRAVTAGLESIGGTIAGTAAKALGDVESAFGDGSISKETVNEANRHVERLTELDSADWQSALREVNQSLRLEVASTDAYVRRMRPTFGYIIAGTWGLLMAAIAYTIVVAPERAAAVVDGVAALAPIWTVGLSVLGVYVYKRSSEKQAGLAGDGPGRPLGLITRALGQTTK